jgi:hypothetical protein
VQILQLKTDGSFRVIDKPFPGERPAPYFSEPVYEPLLSGASRPGERVAVATKQRLYEFVAKSRHFWIYEERP